MMRGGYEHIVGLSLTLLIPLLSGGKAIVLAADGIPEVGLSAVHPICNSTTSSTECIASDVEVQDDIIAALEADEQVTGERKSKVGMSLPSSFRSRACLILSWCHHILT